MQAFLVINRLFATDYTKLTTASSAVIASVRCLVTMRSQAIPCYKIDEQKLSELLDQVYGKNRWKVIVSIISSPKDTANGSAKFVTTTLRKVDGITTRSESASTY